MEHTKHIARAVLLVLLACVAFVVVRHFAIPETFGMYGHYRAASVDEYAAVVPAHGAVGACAECHDVESETLSSGRHGSISCEVCHAPLSTHVQGDAAVAEMLVQRTYRLCAWCHQRLVARAKEFPQVMLAEHVVENGAEMSEAVCLECHDAHSPLE